MDRKLEEAATKEELRTHEANIRRYFEIVAEGLRDQVRAVAEGVTIVDQKVERFRGEMAAEFQDVKSMVLYSNLQSAT